MGHYMAGWTRCAAEDGAVSGGVCTKCTNLPPKHASYVNESGVEVLASGVIYGACPFVCDAGTQAASCQPITPGVFYSTELTTLRDAFAVVFAC